MIDSKVNETSLEQGSELWLIAVMINRPYSFYINEDPKAFNDDAPGNTKKFIEKGWLKIDETAPKESNYLAVIRTPYFEEHIMPHYEILLNL